MLRRKLAQKRKHDTINESTDNTKFVNEHHKSSRNRNAVEEAESESDRVAALEEAVLGIAADVLDCLPQNLAQSKHKKPVKAREAPQKKWEDSDDEDNNQDDFEVDNPSWAKDVDDEDSADSDEESLKAHSHNILTSSSSLPSGSLAFKRVTDANKEDPTSAPLSSVQFHPKATVLLTGGLDNTLRLFAVDGNKNRKVHSMFLERTPVECAKFSRGGSEIIIGSKHKSFYIFDMEGSNGITFRPRLKGLETNNMSYFEVSPDGRFLAFRGSGGYVHLFSQDGKELIDSVKANGDVLSLKFSHDGRYLYTFGVEGEVYVWDLSTRDCIHHFSDDGCIKGKSIAVSPDNKYVALGSESGIVNIYDHEEAMASQYPKPVKQIKNLTTACHEVSFNSHSELLALRTKAQDSGVRLVHFPSMTAFSNFPNHLDSDVQKKLTAMDFSPSSGYLALGNRTGKCLLFRLEHYKQY